MVTKPRAQGGAAAAVAVDEVIRPSSLNCIDLSSSDIHQSVSLLKQVVLPLIGGILESESEFGYEDVDPLCFAGVFGLRILLRDKPRDKRRVHEGGV